MHPEITLRPLHPPSSARHVHSVTAAVACRSRLHDEGVPLHLRYTSVTVDFMQKECRRSCRLCTETPRSSAPRPSAPVKTAKATAPPLPSRGGASARQPKPAEKPKEPKEAAGRGASRDTAAAGSDAGRRSEAQAAKAAAQAVTCGYMRLHAVTTVTYGGGRGALADCYARLLDGPVRGHLVNSGYVCLTGAHLPLDGCAHCHLMGAHCHLMGTHCHLVGAHCHLMGTDCHLMGTHCHLMGAYCHLMGTHCHLVGTHCRAGGAQGGRIGDAGGAD